MEHVVEQVKDACKEWGFFQVINHGVPLHLVQRIHETCKEFFDMDLEEKKKVKRDEVNPYAGEMERLAFKLIEIISLSLGLPGDRLNGYLENQISFVRINHYPPCPFSDMTLGCGQHHDFDVITILAQDNVGGLEVKSKSDGRWVPVKPTPDAFIINVGDICQVWSNDRYKSVEHRAVTNGEKERYSFAFFSVPSHNVVVKPLEELVSKEDPAKYCPYNWGKFFATRNRSDYNKQNVKNIQIQDFKILD
ncbi:Protein DMR6-LIKE OXYGENASE 1 [Linum grandiflorum]